MGERPAEDAAGQEKVSLSYLLLLSTWASPLLSPLDGDGLHIPTYGIPGPVLNVTPRLFPSAVVLPIRTLQLTRARDVFF